MPSSAAQSEQRAAFRAFAEAEVLPRAAGIDRDQCVPEELIQELAARGYLAPWLPEEQGGRGTDLVSCGLLHAEIGRACSSTRSLLTAHGMVAQAIARWGDAEQRRSLLPQLASGERIAAFALSEPNVGSDAAHPETRAERDADGYVLRGAKSWVSFGQRADVYLVLTRLGDAPTAFLVERDRPGLTVHPLRDMLGTRGAMLANLELSGCRVPAASLLGKPGFGFSLVASSALEQGRYSVAWGCVGMLQACLEASVSHTRARRQFGTEISSHQLVRQKITDMMTSLRCAELLCRRAGELRQAGDPAAALETLIAKYQASTAASRAAADAVQLHGALGTRDDHPVARLYRDARVMEIIEGSTQILQTTIAGYAYRDAGTR